MKCSQVLKGVALLAVITLPCGSIASAGVEAPAQGPSAKNSALMNHDVTGVEENAALVPKDDDMISCRLKEGETTFVVALARKSLLEGFTFVNENETAVGELKIFVSNDQLSAESPKWVEVNGSISFTRKRRFNLSMLGVDARYVKLAFKVDKAPRIAAVGR